MMMTDVKSTQPTPASPLCLVPHRTAASDSPRRDVATASPERPAAVATKDSAARITALIRSFNAATTAIEKFDISKQLIEMTEYDVLPPLTKPDMGRFAAKEKAIQSQPFLVEAGEDKAAHGQGSAAVVTITVTGNAPAVFQNVTHGAVRIAPGAPGKIPGFSFAAFTDDTVETRVFATMSRTDYKEPIGQTLLDISVADAEGPLTFTATPDGQLVNLDVKTDCRPALNRFPVDTVLGTIRPQNAPNGRDWQMTVTLASPMRSCEVADRHWHFKRPIHALGWKGAIALRALKLVG